MSNQTFLSELLLSGLSDLPSLQLPLFLMFLLIYLLTLTWNLLIISLIVTDSHLHTPMYFFLGNLASLDICSSSVTVPRMLFGLLTNMKRIAIRVCIVQVFFFMFFSSSEVFLLAVMSYDRYIAICRPLHYMQIMRWNVCLQMALGAWALGFMNSFINAIGTVKLSFCESGIINGFFCDLPQLLQVSCSDIGINILLVFLFAGCLGVGSLVTTFLPYIPVLRAVMKMQTKGSRSKVFSTCSSHLTVVFIFYGTIMSNYYRPTAKSTSTGDKVLSVFYSVLTPLLNPLIYSLRNLDLRAASRGVLVKIISNPINKSS